MKPSFGRVNTRLQELKLILALFGEMLWERYVSLWVDPLVRVALELPACVDSYGAAIERVVCVGCCTSNLVKEEGLRYEQTGLLPRNTQTTPLHITCYTYL